MTLRTLGTNVAASDKLYKVQTMNLRSVVTPSGTNDTAAVNTALAAFDAAGGGKIVIPRDGWKFTGSTGLALTGTANPIHIEAEPGTVFDMTASTAVTGITLGGSVTATSAALGADATKGAETITCSLTPAAGDILRILSTDIFSPSIGRPKGELVEVLSVSGGVITLKSGLWDSYTAATTTVALMQMPRVSVEGLSILRNSNDAALLIQYARNALLGDVYAEGARERLLYIDHALGATVDNCSGRDFWYSGTGTSYGLVVASSQGVEEIGNRFKGGRHAVSHGGTFPCRDVKVVGGTFDNYHPSGQHSFDFHSNCEDVRMIGVTVLNGITSDASNFHGSNLTVRTVSTGIRGAQFGGDHSHDYIKLTDCDIQAGANGDAVLFAPRGGSTAFTISRVEISGYIRSAAGAGVRLAPATSADTGMAIDSMTLNGDIGGQTGFASQLTTAASVTLNTLHVRGRLAGSGSGSALTLTAVPLGKVFIDDGAELTSAVAGVNAAAASADFYIGRAWLEGTDRNYFGTGVLTMLNTVLKGFANVGGISAGSAASAFLDNLTTISVSGTPSLPATTRGKVDVQRFTSSGTWTKPAYAREVEVLLIGSGAGGGAGARGPSGTALSGGTGGGGGALSIGKFPASSLSATVAVTIPTAGTGAVAQTTDGTAGAGGGSPSGGSTFGAYLTASRGTGGGGGGLASAGTAGAGGVGIASGSSGGLGSATGAAGSLGGTAAGAAAGGGGGGITTAPLHTAGGNGGISAVYSTTAAVAGTAGGGTGPNGAATTTDSAGAGGAGGGGNTGGAGGAGGNGGTYGAGGGGGGASLNGSASGKGGDGAGGLCVVITYY